MIINVIERNASDYRIYRDFYPPLWQHNALSHWVLFILYGFSYTILRFRQRSQSYLWREGKYSLQLNTYICIDPSLRYWNMGVGTAVTWARQNEETRNLVSSSLLVFYFSLAFRLSSVCYSLIRLWLLGKGFRLIRTYLGAEFSDRVSGRVKGFPLITA
jgi:hypothetical protein